MAESAPTIAPEMIPALAPEDTRKPSAPTRNTAHITPRYYLQTQGICGKFHLFISGQPALPVSPCRKEPACFQGRKFFSGIRVGYLVGSVPGPVVMRINAVPGLLVAPCVQPRYERHRNQAEQKA